MLLAASSRARTVQVAITKCCRPVLPPRLKSPLHAHCTPSITTACSALQVETASESSTPRGAWESPAGEPAAGRAPFAQQRPAVVESSVPAWLSNWRLKLALSSQVIAVAVLAPVLAHIPSSLHLFLAPDPSLPAAEPDAHTR